MPTLALERSEHMVITEAIDALDPEIDDLMDTMNEELHALGHADVRGLRAGYALFRADLQAEGECVLTQRVLAEMGLTAEQPLSGSARGLRGNGVPFGRTPLAS
jgi:hypothetical protein